MMIMVRPVPGPDSSDYKELITRDKSLSLTQIPDMLMVTELSVKLGRLTIRIIRGIITFIWIGQFRPIKLNIVLIHSGDPGIIEI